MRTPTQPTARARRSFWTLAVIAVLSMGALSAALKAEPSPAAGAAVGVSGTILAVSLTLAGRVLLALDRARGSTNQRRHLNHQTPDAAPGSIGKTT
jgi:hypothetical protein